MDQDEFMLRARSVLQRTMRGMEDVADKLQEILNDDDDSTLAATHIGDESDMQQEKNIIELKRDEVKQLEREVSEAYKRKLDHEKRAREWKANQTGIRSHVEFQDSLSIRKLLRKERTATGNQILPKPPRPPREDVQITPEVRRWIKLHAPDRLPEQQPQELTPVQLAAEAHSDYVSKQFQLQRARMSLQKLETKIRDARELAQCYAEVA